MISKRVYDRDGDSHFVTFSCYQRRRLLDHDDAKLIVIDILNDQLNRQRGRCVGFVVMPDHVHAIVWFPLPDQLSYFMKQWKQRSSVAVEHLLPNQAHGLCRELQHEGSDLASTVLRLQSLLRTEDRGEAPLHAPEPGESRAGGVSLRLEVEFGGAATTEGNRSGSMSVG